MDSCKEYLVNIESNLFWELNVIAVIFTLFANVLILIAQTVRTLLTFKIFFFFKKFLFF